MKLPCPPLDAALVRWLHDTYPERSARQGDTVKDLMFRGGQRAVVNFLLQELKRQEEKNVPLKTKDTKA